MYSIVSVLLFSLTYAKYCTTVTEKCPIGELSWKRRAQQFVCLNENGKYTCLRDVQNNLVETCVNKVWISKGVVGCPYVLLCKNNLGLIGLDDNFHDCSTYNSGCPPKNHTGYALHEIYKYPSCSTLDSSKEKEKNKIRKKQTSMFWLEMFNYSSKVTDEKTYIQDNEFSSSTVTWIYIVIASVGNVMVVSISLGTIINLRRKNVKCPCYGHTKQSDNVELGTSLLRAKKDGPDDMELRDETTQFDIRQFGKEMKGAIESRNGGRIMEKVDEWKKEPVRIGLVGPPKVGKSSFINSMLGNATSIKAKIGPGSTITLATVYGHPKYKGLEFCDLPYYGSTMCNLKAEYFKNMNVEHYDLWLIFYSSTISETDINFVRHLLEMKIKFAIVKTKADHFDGPDMKHKPFDYWISLAKKKCRSTLNEEGIKKEVPIFVISNVSPCLGDFDILINFMAKHTPEIKRMTIVLTIKRQTYELINKKESQLLDRAWKAAIAIGISSASPTPDIEIAFNMPLMEQEIILYLDAFNLDEDSLKEHPNHIVKRLKTCHTILKVGQVRFITNIISEFSMFSNVDNVFESVLPSLGGIINGSASVYCTYMFLKSVIADLAEDARTLNKLQTESIL